MTRYNARTECFMEVQILNHPALFTPIRIDRKTIPQGYHLYEVRSDSYGEGDAVEIAYNILADHWGSLIMRDKIELSSDGRLHIEPDNLSYNTGDCHYLNDYIMKHPL